MMLDCSKKKWNSATASSRRPARYMEATTALQVKTVGRVREKTAWRAVEEAESRSLARMRDWTRLWRLSRGPTRADVESGSRGAFGSGGGRGELGSRRRAYSGGSIRSRRLRRRRSAAASSAEENAKVLVEEQIGAKSRDFELASTERRLRRRIWR